MALAGAMAATTHARAERPAPAPRLRIALYLPRPRGDLHGDVGPYDRAALRGLDLWSSGAAEVRSTGVAPPLTVGGGDGDPAAIRAWYTRVAPSQDALVAPYGSVAAAAAFDAAEATSTPCLAPSAGASALWAEPRTWCVGLLEPTPTFFHGTLRWLAARGAGDGALALLHRDDPFSTAVMDGAAREARRLGLAQVRRRAFTTDDDRDAAARSTTEPAVLAIGWVPGGAGDGFLDDAVALARGVPRTPGTTLALGVGGGDPAFAHILGPAADGVLGVTGWRPYLTTPGNRAFVAAYRLRWGEDPDAHAAQGFAAGQVLGRADRLARPRHGPSGQRLRDALHALEVETVFGRYAVDGHGRQVGHEPAVVRWCEGRPHPVDIPPSTARGTHEGATP